MYTELKNLISLIIDYRGKTPLKLGSDWSSSGYRALSAKNIKTGKIVNEESIRYVDENLYKKWMKNEILRGDIFITSEAPFGEVYYWNSDEKIVLSQRLFAIRPIKSINSQYLYFYMATEKFHKELESRATGSTVTGLRQPELLKCKINVKPIEEQQHIVNILGSLDDKIENNENIIAQINKLATLFYKEECNKESKVVSLGDYIKNYDKERKPLSSRERNSLKKLYPYYGATEVVDFVDNYLFDGDYVLLGEDGTVIDAQGFPIIQRVNGKFWANNHTHILKGINNIDNNILEVVLKNTNVKSIVTGAVQLKINQSNMNNLKILLPINLNSLKNKIQPLFVKRFNLLNQNKELSKQKRLYLQKFFG